MIVMLITLRVTCKMLKYMKESDIVKSQESEERRKKEIRVRIKSKEKQLKQKELMSHLSGPDCGSQIERLKDDISELRDML